MVPGCPSALRSAIRNPVLSWPGPRPRYGGGSCLTLGGGLGGPVAQHSCLISVGDGLHHAVRVRRHLHCAMADALASMPAALAAARTRGGADGVCACT